MKRKTKQNDVYSFGIERPLYCAAFKQTKQEKTDDDGGDDVCAVRARIHLVRLFNVCRWFFSLFLLLLLVVCLFVSQQQNGSCSIILHFEYAIHVDYYYCLLLCTRWADLCCTKSLYICAVFNNNDYMNFSSDLSNTFIFSSSNISIENQFAFIIIIGGCVCMFRGLI